MFVMPKPELGQTVLYYHQGDRSAPPVIGIVTEIGREGVAVSLIRAGCSNLDPRAGVRHIDDPIFKEHPLPAFMNRSGGWEFMKIPQVTTASSPAVTPSVLYSVGSTLTEKQYKILRLRFEQRTPPSVIAQRTGSSPEEIKAFLEKYTPESAAIALKSKVPPLEPISV